MSGNKILSALRDFFDEKRKKQKKQKNDLIEILAKLERYQKKLEKNLHGESKKKKIQQLEAEINIVKRKSRKAHKLLESL